MTAIYVSESEPLDTIRDLLDDNWVEFEDIPRPNFVITNESDELAFARVNLNEGDYIIIRPEGAESIRLRGNISYYDRAYPISLEILTMESRQRLRDLWRHIKAICFDNKHSFTGYQLIRIGSYQESVNIELQIWRGFVRLQVEAAGVSVESLI